MRNTCIALLFVLPLIVVSATDRVAADLELSVTKPVWVRTDHEWMRPAGLLEPVYGYRSGWDLLLETRKPVFPRLGENLCWIWGSFLESGAIGGARWELALISATGESGYVADLATLPNTELMRRFSGERCFMFGAVATYDRIEWMRAEVRVGAGEALASAYCTVWPRTELSAAPFLSVFTGLYDVSFDSFDVRLQSALIIGVAGPPRGRKRS